MVILGKFGNVCAGGLISAVDPPAPLLLELPKRVPRARVDDGARHAVEVLELEPEHALPPRDVKYRALHVKGIDEELPEHRPGLEIRSK